MSNDGRYILALNAITGIGPQSVRQLIDHFGSAEDALRATANEFREAPQELQTIGRNIQRERSNALGKADQQYEYAERYNVRIISYDDKDNYPRRLLQCPDAPVVLFVLGNVNFETAKVISVVGTRRPTDNGRVIANRIVSDLCLQHPDLIVVSGMAYGIDIVAHRAALKAHRPTVGCMAHGLSMVYPSQHNDTAREIVRQGGALVSEFNFGVLPETYNFISRNRIIAGLADATLVVESGLKGGSMVTVRRASQYCRTVLAVPGLAGSEHGAGCNKSIKTGVASLVENAEDVEAVMGWNVPAAARHVVGSLFPEPLTDDEQTIADTLRTEDGLTASLISIRSGMPIHKVNTTLLTMEFKNLVKSLPGNSYRLMM